jgi:hypothetical protein
MQFQSPGAEAKAYSMRDIPAEVKRVMIAEYQKQGHPYDDETLIDAYNQNVVEAARLKAKATRAP